MKTVIEMAEDVGAGIADLPLEDAVLFEVDILSGRSEKLERFAELVRADERERFMQAVEELRPVQSIPLLQNKPPEFWIDGFKRAIEAVAQPEERNFCPRCGKRTADLTTIHTCTPPQEIA